MGKNKKPAPDASQAAWDRYNKGKEATKRWYTSERGKVNTIERARKWRQVHPEAAKAASRKKKFGITEHDFQLMLDLQGGRCAICRCTSIEAKELYSQAFGVDHDHVTGKNRGLLCPPCNSGIGMLKDSPELLRVAAEYIERSR